MSADGSTTAASGAGDDQARRVFDQLDLNHDEKLSFDEFARATIRQK